MKAGWVYFGRRKDGLIKIGFSANPLERVRTLGVDLVACVRGSRADEAATHLRFAASSAIGFAAGRECFFETPDLRDEMASHPVPDDLPVVEFATIKIHKSVLAKLHNAQRAYGSAPMRPPTLSQLLSLAFDALREKNATSETQ